MADLLSDFTMSAERITWQARVMSNPLGARQVPLNQVPRIPPPPRNHPAPPNRTVAALNGVPTDRTRRVLPPPRNPATPTRGAQNRLPPAQPLANRPPPPRNPATPYRGAQNRIPPPRPLVNRPPPTVACLICTDPVHVDKAISLPCHHAYCPPCFVTGFWSSLTTMPFRPMHCCQQPIPIYKLRNSTIIPAEETVAYRKKLAEFNTPRPTYCFDPKCSAFIPDVLGGTCRVCRKKTCTSCGMKSHGGGVCTSPSVPRSMAQVAERRFKRLSDLMGWKTCPGCRRVVEKIDGCNHIQWVILFPFFPLFPFSFFLFFFAPCLLLCGLGVLLT